MFQQRVQRDCVRGTREIQIFPSKVWSRQAIAPRKNVLRCCVLSWNSSSLRAEKLIGNSTIRTYVETGPNFAAAQSGSSATSLAYTFIRPILFTPKVTRNPVNTRRNLYLVLLPANPPPRRCARAIMTSGRNQSQRPPTTKYFLFSSVPVS